MKIRNILTLIGLSAGLCSTANAQFSASGPGATIPASGSGGGGTWTTVLPPTPGTSSVTIPGPVSGVTSIDIDGLTHTWIGDLQVVLVDPNGVGHNIMLRPGVDFAGSTVGNSGDFIQGNYSFVESGGLNLPVDNVAADQFPGVYNQTFSTGVTVWPAGQLNINNTPMSMITGPAGIWSLTIYDWAGGDTGLFTGWTMNGSGGAQNAGAAYCFGDGTGANCPCSAFGATGEGCATTSGQGAVLVGAGNAEVGNDTFVLSVSGAPANKPGIFFQGANQLSAPAGDGILCSNALKRYAVNPTDASGAATQSGFSAFASVGASLNYQYWFRDPANVCSGLGFNFSNGWTVAWN